MSCDRTDYTAAGYVDGELDLTNQVEMERHLRDCGDCLREVETLQGMRAMLRRSALAYAAPAGLRARIEAALPDTARGESGGVESVRPANRPWLSRWAVAFAMVAISALAAWRIVPRLPSARGDQQLAAEVFASHLRSLEANHLMDVASTDQHTVKPWFDGKLNFSPPVGDLASSGFPLVGGRLDYLQGREVAALIYQRRQHYINVFVWPAAPGAASQVDAAAFQGYNLKNWSQGGFEFYAVSDVNADDLNTFVRLLQSNIASN